MIIEGFIEVFLGIVKGIFYLVPSIPQMDSSIITGVNTMTGYLVGSVAFVAYLFTPALLIFILSSTIVILNFDFFYSVTMWVIRKLPFNVS